MKPNRNILIAGMVLGGLLLFSTWFGIHFAWNHAGAFFNVALPSDPALTSLTNNIVLGATIAGLLGIVVLPLSVVGFIRSAPAQRHGTR